MVDQRLERDSRERARARESANIKELNTYFRLIFAQILQQENLVRLLSGSGATIDRNDCARDKTSRIRSQKHRHGSDIVGIADPADWNMLL